MWSSSQMVSCFVFSRSLFQKWCFFILASLALVDGRPLNRNITDTLEEFLNETHNMTDVNSILEALDAFNEKNPNRTAEEESGLELIGQNMLRLLNKQIEGLRRNSSLLNDANESKPVVVNPDDFVFQTPKDSKVTTLEMATMRPSLGTQKTTHQHPTATTRANSFTTPKTTIISLKDETTVKPTNETTEGEIKASTTDKPRTRQTTRTQTTSETPELPIEEETESVTSTEESEEDIESVDFENLEDEETMDSETGKATESPVYYDDKDIKKPIEDSSAKEKRTTKASVKIMAKSSAPSKDNSKNSWWRIASFF